MSNNSVKKFIGNIIITSGLFLLLIIQLIFSGFAFAEKQGNDIKNAVVKIYTIHSKPSYSNPWMMLPPSIINGTGFIIDNNKILTAAHIIADQTYIQVKKNGSSKHYNADVLSVSHEADIAILGITDKEFFEGVTPLKLGDLPEINEKVQIYGFPAGHKLLITDGTISMIDRLEYKHSSNYFLAGKISASIKPGNSGGPVISNSRVAGIIMQASSTKKIAHMIPAPVIKHFLKDIADEHYDGIPDAGIITQTITNNALKNIYNIDGDHAGVLINKVLPGSEAENKLQKNDIVLAINGYNIRDDGNVEFRPGEWTDYNYFIEMQQCGEKINLDIMRSGRIRELNLSLHKTRKDFLLIQNEQYDKKPKYFIFGGIVFSTLTKDLLNSCDDIPEELTKELSKRPTKEKREVVIALKVLPANINKEYHNLNRWIVSEVNGHKFKDINELHNLVKNASDPNIIFGNTNGYQVVIDRKKAEESHKEILSAYNIKKDCSTDLQSLHAESRQLSKIYQ